MGVFYYRKDIVEKILRYGIENGDLISHEEYLPEKRVYLYYMDEFKRSKIIWEQGEGDINVLINSNIWSNWDPHIYTGNLTSHGVSYIQDIYDIFQKKFN